MSGKAGRLLRRVKRQAAVVLTSLNQYRRSEEGLESMTDESEVLHMDSRLYEACERVSCPEVQAIAHEVLQFAASRYIGPTLSMPVLSVSGS